MFAMTEDVGRSEAKTKVQSEECNSADEARVRGEEAGESRTSQQVGGAAGAC